MRMKIKLITPVMLALFLGGMLIASVSACPIESHGCKPFRCKPLRCELSLEIDWLLPGWRGTVTGDIEGVITWTLQKYTIRGTMEFFFETWVIETDDGSISGFDAGVYNLETFKWVSMGRVTAATGEWHYLVGCKMHTSGTTTPFIPGGEVTGVGTLTIVPCWHW
jgi:hypothetical protein